jgi:hypothetical protein
VWELAIEGAAFAALQGASREALATGEGRAS